MDAPPSRAFEAPHALALVQADARDGIWLDTPGGRKKTYLFLWIDDFSRKILFGKYYFDEKLARPARQLPPTACSATASHCAYMSIIPKKNKCRSLMVNCFPPNR